MTIVTPTDRPKSVRNRCVIEGFGGVCVLSLSQVSSFDFSTLYISLPHDLIKAKVLSLVNLCFNRESKTYLCTSVKAGFFSKRNMTRINVGLARSYVKLLLSSWKTYSSLIPIESSLIQLQSSII